MAAARVGMKKLVGALKMEGAVKSMLKDVENRKFLVVPNIIILQYMTKQTILCCTSTQLPLRKDNN
ncbi:hypothetical protein BTV98_00715 [Psychrobacter sp. Cmf 22.2]|nr:hypothetical protein BTV98_00715 [Psychrobacter sp. Cmf 22.2]